MAGIEEFLAGTIRLSTPLILAALGEVVVQRAGVINLGIEGMMLLGAFCGFAVASATGSAATGAAAAAAAGCLVAALFGYLCVARSSDQIVVGMGVNIAMIGLTGVLFRSLFGIDTGATAPALGEVALPGLSLLPVAGRALFTQSILVYLSGVAAVGLWAFLRNPYSLGLKASGIHPEAADAAGVKVHLTRWISVLFGGTMAGLAGGYLTLSQTSTFAENMTNGRGFIALAVVIFGRWNPVGLVFAALLFGGANQTQFWFQARGSVVDVMGHSVALPYQLLLALPYMATLLALAMFAGQYRGPRALGRPFVRST